MPFKILRERAAGQAPVVTNMELFFDLVYVFAVTQLSHRLLTHLNLRGAVETLVLFLGVWWAWNLTAWATNWIDPDRNPVRGLMVVLMLLSLVMAAAIPEAFSEKGLSFAIAYVLLQVVRSGFVVYAFHRDPSRMQRNFAQLLAWGVISGVFWIAGGLAHGDARLALWVVAAGIDYAAPLHGFALPHFGSTPLSDWTLAGGHLAERNQLVVLIALGESILAAGATFSGLETSTKSILSFAIGFAGAVSLWWIYFARDNSEGEAIIEHTPEPTRLGRNGFAYGHGIMVAGIIVVAVAIDLTMSRPDGGTGRAEALVLLGGPALYLAGNALFNHALTGRAPVSRFVGIVALAAAAPLAWVSTPLELGAVSTAIVLALAALTGHSRLPRSLSATAR